jgi:hypothetical protein
MFSSADLSLAAGKMRKSYTGGFRYDFTEPQAVFCKHFHRQIRRFRVFEAGLKLVSNFKGAS